MTKNLLNDFYQIADYRHTDHEIETNVVINPMHPIFNGHFPEQPVVPGVCMMQMVKEITSRSVQHHLQLINASDMKFLAVIDPIKNNRVTLKIQCSPVVENTVQVNAIITSRDIVHFKFKGSFRLV